MRLQRPPSDWPREDAVNGLPPIGTADPGALPANHRPQRTWMPLAQWVRLALFFSSASSSSRLAFPPLILIPLEFSRCDHRTFSFSTGITLPFYQLSSRVQAPEWLPLSCRSLAGGRASAPPSLSSSESSPSIHYLRLLFQELDDICFPLSTHQSPSHFGSVEIASRVHSLKKHFDARRLRA